MSQNNPEPPRIENPLPGVAPGVASGARQDLQNAGDVLEQAKAYIDERIGAHIHGQDATRINLNTDIFGLIEVVTAVPTAAPRDLYDQIKIYVSGGTKTLYLYDYVNHAWLSVGLT